MQHFAKVAIASQGQTTGGQTRQDFENEIIKRADRRDGESSAQAFTRYATTTEDGKILFKAALLAPPRQVVQDLPAKKPESAGPASKELEDLARYMARSKKYTFQQAYSELYTDPERAELVARVKREEADLKRRVSDARFPLRDAEESSETEQWVRDLDAVGRRRFRPDSL
jgi:hypothetical protein